MLTPVSNYEILRGTSPYSLLCGCEHTSEISFSSLNLSNESFGTMQRTWNTQNTKSIHRNVTQEEERQLQGEPFFQPQNIQQCTNFSTYVQGIRAPLSSTQDRTLSISMALKQYEQQEDTTTITRRKRFPKHQRTQPKEEEGQRRLKVSCEMGSKNLYVLPTYIESQWPIRGLDELMKSALQPDYSFLIKLNYLIHSIRLPLIALNYILFSIFQLISARLPKNSPVSRAINANSLYYSINSINCIAFLDVASTSPFLIFFPSSILIIPTEHKIPIIQNLGINPIGFEYLKNICKYANIFHIECFTELFDSCPFTLLCIYTAQNNFM